MTAERKLSLAVIIPSRLQRIQPLSDTSQFFFERAIASVVAQQQVRDGHVAVTVILGLDEGARMPDYAPPDIELVIANSDVRSQAGALNAGIAALRDHHDMVAFLEDDDRWDPQYLTWGLAALQQYGFASSTQLEVDPADQIIRINDFPTPSGWIMAAATLRQVGPFDPSMRWHLDNDWLGRLAESGIGRCHLVEITAPVTVETSQQTRPWIANVLRHGGGAIEVKRHTSLAPLVVRAVHPRSGMAMIATNPEYARQSTQEVQRLVDRFGRIPW